MFEHESTNGKTYEIAYEVTLVAEFHSIPLPAWVTAVPADAFLTMLLIDKRRGLHDQNNLIVAKSGES